MLSAGCDDFVRKPFQQSVIVDKLIKHLGVEFIYEDSVTVAADPDPAQAPLSFESIRALPAQWRAQLYESATHADQTALLQLLESIPSDQAHLRRTLRSWITNFQFDKIMALTRSEDEYDSQS